MLYRFTILKLHKNLEFGWVGICMLAAEASMRNLSKSELIDHKRCYTAFHQMLLFCKLDYPLNGEKCRYRHFALAV
jgi:hypothetical protein